MLATMPSGTSHNLSTGVPINADEDRLCAGCNQSVSSETGGVVVAFGNSLWHVDCFKCAKCRNQVNADTNLLLLSDGSPVCAKCYNCKVCNLPILDEAVMTGDDSYHAACFTCRSCKSRIDELVFAKTSQGFYCMKCHNERVARSRRHMARQKQRERDRERAALGSSSGRSTNSRHREDEAVNGTSNQQDSVSSSTGRRGYASGGSSNEDHSRGTRPLNTSQARPRTADSMNRGENSVANASFTSMNSAAAATLLQSHSDGRSASPAPPSINVAGPTAGSSSQTDLNRSLSDSTSQAVASTRDPGKSRPSLDGTSPPPYSVTPPPNADSSGVDSARSSTSYSYNNSSRSGPASPSLTAPTSNEGSVSASGTFVEQSASTSLPYLNGANASYKERPVSPTAEIEQSKRTKRYDDGTRPLSILLQPSASSSSGGLTVAKDKRSKRGSINPGLQLEASKLFSNYSERASRPSSPNAIGSASSPPGSQARTYSPTQHLSGRDSPRVTSPLRDYFNGSEGDSSGSTTFYSPAPSPQLHKGLSPSSPRSQTTPAPSSAKAPVKEFLAKLPPRADSLNSTVDSSSSKTTFQTPEPFPGRSTPSPNGSLNAPKPMLRSQRSFDERGGRLSPRKAEFGVDSGKRSRSVSPQPPDVPRSIESGTDTETDMGNDSDDITQSYMDRTPVQGPNRDRPSSQPPALPPKDIVSLHTDEQRSRSQSLSEVSATEDGEPDRDTPDSPNPVSSMESRTSGFFMTPALPPMRFSMTGPDFRDFRDILSSYGGEPGPLGQGEKDDSAQTVTIREEKAEDVGSARTPTSMASTVTPENKQERSRTDVEEKEEYLRVKRSMTPDTITSPQENGKFSLSRSASINPAAPSLPETPRKMPHRPTRSETAIKILEEPISPRSLPKSPRPVVVHTEGSSKNADSNVALHVNGVPAGTGPRSSMENQDRRPSLSKIESSDLVFRRLKEALNDATERGSDYVKLDKSFIEAILTSLEQKNKQFTEISHKLDGMKRTSQMMFDGLSVAQEEYDQECIARRNAEAEVSRLKVELSGQAARLTALQSDDRRREVQKQLTKELSNNLTGLERDLSKLKVERDMTLAEVEELSASKSQPSGSDIPVATVSRSLTMRLDNIKKQYSHELVPLTQQREALVREIAELKEARDIFLEETAVLNARNEELAQLNAQYERRLDLAPSTPGHSKEKSLPSIQPAPSKQSFDTWKARQAPPMVVTTSTTSTASSTTLFDEPTEIRTTVQRPSTATKVDDTPTTQRRLGLRWPGNKLKEAMTVPSANGDNLKSRKGVEHAFQQLSILRFARCDHCNDKMWGSQVRCSACNLAVHVRCVNLVQSVCTHDGTSNGHEDHVHTDGPPPPSMFGRDLVEQVRADTKGSERFIPVIVEKCIDAVEASGMDYEGIYRKTGGTGQSKAITSLFERGNYEAFDLCDSDAFNDISSVTSVMKNYFRSLPNPLLTYTLHEAFVSAATIRDPEAKGKSLKDLVAQLPSEHYHTLSYLMLHLHRVQKNAEVNLMNARNLGVIFGPTLMRSRDPSREFADMAGKSLAIEWLIENAPFVFGVSRP